MNALKTINQELICGRVHIVPDIETLSTVPNSMILSIGAVAICNGKIIAEFYQNINPSFYENNGYEASESTLKWWNSPELAEAKKDLQDEQVIMVAALKLFGQWCKEVKGEQIWGYGSDFDVVILKNAFDKEGIKWPFDFWNHRCLRTLCDVLSIKVPRDKGVHHNAFADAVNQGQTLIKCFEYLSDQAEKVYRLESLDD